MTTDLATLQPAELGQPLTAEQLKSRLRTIQSVMKDVMQRETDYGVIPGTDKPSLFKPGAEKLCVTFRLAADDPRIDELPDPRGHIRYRVHVPVRAASGAIIAVGVGECSTGEEKYAWRRPVHVKEFEAAAEDQRREKWTRKGDVWQQVRTNPADVANTVLKMAHKRAYVHAVIMATAAGAIFTQDIEDLPEGVAADETDQRRPPVQPPQRRSTKANAAPAGAGTTVTVTIATLEKKSGETNGTAWTRWTATGADGHKYGTLKAELGAVLEDADETKVPVAITYTEGKWGRNIEAAALVEREPGSDDA